MLPVVGLSELATGAGTGGTGIGALISEGLSTISVFVIESVSPSAGAVVVAGAGAGAVLGRLTFKLSSDGTFLILTLFMDWVDDFLRTWSAFGTKDALLAMAEVSFPSPFD